MIDMAFDPQPVLGGISISVRPLRREDFDAPYAVARDPLIWEQHPVRDRHRLDVFRCFFDEAIQSCGALAVDSAKGTLIGSSRFHGFNEQLSEVGDRLTFLARSHWGGSTNRELRSLMLSHAFRFVERVVFLIGPDNRRSQRALEKIGARRAGMRMDGSSQPDVLYEIYRDHWLELSGAAS
jgi:N-acetyltransferase